MSESQWFQVRPGGNGEVTPVDGPTGCLAPGRCSCCGTLDWTDEQLASVFGRYARRCVYDGDGFCLHPGVHSLEEPKVKTRLLAEGREIE